MIIIHEACCRCCHGAPSLRVQVLSRGHIAYVCRRCHGGTWLTCADAVTGHIADVCSWRCSCTAPHRRGFSYIVRYVKIGCAVDAVTGAHSLRAQLKTLRMHLIGEFCFQSLACVVLKSDHDVLLTLSRGQQIVCSWRLSYTAPQRQGLFQ